MTPGKEMIEAQRSKPQVNRGLSGASHCAPLARRLHDLPEPGGKLRSAAGSSQDASTVVLGVSYSVVPRRCQCRVDFPLRGWSPALRAELRAAHGGIGMLSP